MHILFLPSFYPEFDAPFNGLFFKNQSLILVKSNTQIGTVYVEQKSLKKLFINIRSNCFQKSINNEEGIVTYRYHGINLFNNYKLGGLIWVYITEKLVKEYIKEHGKPDFIHAHNVFLAGKVAYNLNKKFKIPYLITEHASGFLLNEYSPKKLENAALIYKNAAHVLSVSNALANAIKDLCRITKITIIPNVVNTDLFEYLPTVKKDERFTFVSVGNLLINKGHHVLIKAFYYFNLQFSNSQLRIVGEGPEFQNLESLILTLGLKGKVLLDGRKTPVELASIYQKSHCLVLPSFKETFGVVIIEAMACGIPVIATKSGGPEYIINKTNGLLVNSGNPKEMKVAMVNIFQNYLSYNFNEIRNFTNENFGQRAISEKLLKLYNTIR
jgi:glycosyltransferase involved in cell wall biosynthesis